MLDRLSGRPVHEFIHFIALLAIAVGLPWSKIPMSLGTMLLALNCLLKGDFKMYGARIKEAHWSFHAFLLFLAWEWISLFWTSDWNYALDDFRIKLPLYSIPVCCLLVPLKEKFKQLLLFAFLSSLLVIVSINLAFYFQLFGYKKYVDLRELSLFGSHIRFGLLVVIGLTILILEESIKQKIPLIIRIILIVYLLYYTFISQVLSAYLALFISMVFCGFIAIRNIKKIYKLGISLLFGLFVIGIVSYTLYWIIPPVHKVELSKMDKISPDGNAYLLDKEHLVWENGYPVQAFVDQKVIEQKWNQVSEIDYATGKDKKGIPIYWTIWRYMSSKGLRKDSDGFSKLNSQDIHNIENGYSSVIALKSAFHERLHGVQEEIAFNHNPNGHSLLQRLAYWKAGFTIIKKNPIFGQGTGDVQAAFSEYYKNHSTKLEERYQLRAHNLYMTIVISSGIIGFFFFLFWWIGSIKRAFQVKNWLGLAFCFIALSSFLTEDTIETQMGVTLIAFFYGFFMLNQRKQTEIGLAN